jgi:aspartyl-tRNA synthetase
MQGRILIAALPDHVGEAVSIAGWVSVRRDHGKLIFLDIRDESGSVQSVILPNYAEALAAVQPVRSEWVVEIEGRVNPRPEKLVNPDQRNGGIEIEVLSVSILNEAETPVFDTLSDGKEIGEETRLRYRYADLRRERMQKNVRNRHRVAQHIRNFYTDEGFVEIETPCMTRSTPEGSRDFIVPSRLEKGKFYALPQSPQQYKQLLMAAGFEKYFQIARCFRDEDTRGDRQPEFTQVDMEMSFVSQEDLMRINERLVVDLVKAVYPEKRIQEIPFPRIAYREAMEKYDSDKPDIRTDKNDPNLLAFCWVVDFPLFEKDEKGGWTFSHNPFSAPKPEYAADLLEGRNIGDIVAAQYDMVLNGYEIGGGGIRNHDPEALRKVFEIMGYEAEEDRREFRPYVESARFGSAAARRSGIRFRSADDASAE